MFTHTMKMFLLLALLVVAESTAYGQAVMTVQTRTDKKEGKFIEIIGHRNGYAARGITKAEFNLPNRAILDDAPIAISFVTDTFVVKKEEKKIDVRYTAEYSSSSVSEVLTCRFVVVYKEEYENILEKEHEKTFAEAVQHETDRMNKLLEAKRGSSNNVVNNLHMQLEDRRGRIAEIQRSIEKLEKALDIVPAKTVEELTGKLWLESIQLSNQIAGNKTMMKALEREMEGLRKKQPVDEISKQLESERVLAQKRLLEVQATLNNPKHPMVLQATAKLAELEKKIAVLKSNSNEKATPVIEEITDSDGYLALSTRLRDTRIETETMENKLKSVNEAIQKVKQSNTFSNDVENYRSDIKMLQKAVERIQEQLLELSLKELQHQKFELVPLK